MIRGGPPTVKRPDINDLLKTRQKLKESKKINKLPILET